MKKLALGLGQIAALAAVAAVCGWLSDALDLLIPGNVLGIALLFALLCSGLIREEHLALGASFLLRHLIFFFVPFAVGLMNFGDVFVEHGPSLGLAVLAGTLAPALAVLLVARALRAGRG